MGSYGQVMWAHPPVNGHHKKKVIMGRNFLLVSRDCLRESKFGRRFQFFHKPSLSSVVVKVQEHIPTDLNLIVEVVDELMISEVVAQSPL